MTLIAPILSTFIGQVAVWLMLILLLASAPNSSPDQEAAIKAWCFTTAAIELASLAAAVWLMVVHHTTLSSVAGVVPLAFCIVALLVMLKAQS